jgi:hypothetical protein
MSTRKNPSSGNEQHLMMRPAVAKTMTNLNRKQRMVLYAGCVVLILTCLYPPWVQSWKFVAGGEDLVFRIEPGSEGYSWIFRPPGAPPWIERNLRVLDGKDLLGVESEESEIPETAKKLALKSVRMNGPWRAQIDIVRLLAEWLMIAAGVFAGVVCFGSDKRS